MTFIGLWMFIVVQQVVASQTMFCFRLSTQPPPPPSISEVQSALQILIVFFNYNLISAEWCYGILFVNVLIRYSS